MIKVRELRIVADSNKARRARDILLEQEQLEPDNSMVQAYLSQCTNHFVVTGMTHWREGRAEMMRYARRAVEADPANSLAYHCLSCAKQYHGHAEAALPAAERAIELNPCAMHGHFWSGTSKILLGRAEEALADLAILERLSPLDPELYIKHIATSRAQHVLQRYDKAVDAARLAVQMMPDAPFVYLSLISALALSGRIERAKQEVETFHTKFPDLEIEPKLVHFVTREPDDLERFKQGLRDANLNLA